MTPKLIIWCVFSHQLGGGRSRWLNESARGLNGEAWMVGSISERCRDWYILLTRRGRVRVWLVAPCAISIVPGRKRICLEIPPIEWGNRGCNCVSSTFFSHLSLISFSQNFLSYYSPFYWLNNGPWLGLDI